MSTEIIVALDFDNFNDAKQIVDKLDNSAQYYKVGLEQYVSSGVQIIEYIKNKNKKVFLDLKFHDIPNTASKVVKAAASIGVDMMNVHVQGGVDMMKACVYELDEVCAKKNIHRPLLIGVTLLTSLDDEHLKAFSIDSNSADYVLQLSKLAKLSGLDGVVSSARETKLIKDNLGADFITVTPGIRPAASELGDQKRVVTPKMARELKTDYIVVGRPITASLDPKKITEKINMELS